MVSIFDPTAKGATLAACEDAIARAFPDVPEISADAMPVDARVYDVREKAEYDISHIPGAIHVTPGDVPDPGGAPDGRVIVCACSVGLRSAKLAAALRARGWTGAVNLRGGLFRWAKEGRDMANASGPTREIHPFDKRWGKLLDEGA
ncbi:MAG: rhodanese-like domain-containing protein [Proteobacteria bacterium]|nr:rhodanese-like domain-containing protein [Pseudomonadota bacterium]